MTERGDGRSRPRKRFGQHFLEPVWAGKVVAAIAPGRDDVFLEIGPGRGAITRPLAAAVRYLVAIEIDRDLAATLVRAALPRVTVLTGDVLDTRRADIDEALRDAGIANEHALRVAGNLPYNLASPILFRLCALVAEGLALADATVMLQREVADRLTARCGTAEYGVLSVLIRLVATVDRLLELPPGAFRPPPKVRSSVVRLRFHAPTPRPVDAAGFTALVRDVFTRRRKTLANALLAHGGLAPDQAAQILVQTGIEGRRRPETLAIEEFVRLSDALAVLRASDPPDRDRPVV